MWSGNGPIKTIDSPGYAEALRMAQAEDETLGIRNIYGTRSSKESQCPRTDLNKTFLPRPKTITA